MRARLTLLILLALGAAVQANPTDITPDHHKAVFDLLDEHLIDGRPQHLEQARARARRARSKALVAFVEKWSAASEDERAVHRRVLLALQKANQMLRSKKPDREAALRTLADAEADIETALPGLFALSALRRRGDLLYSLGRYAESLATLERAERAALDIGHQLGAFLASIAKVRVHMIQRDAQGAAKAIGRCHELLEGLNRPYERGLAWLMQAELEGKTRQFDKAHASVQRVLENAIAASAPQLMARAYMAQGAIYSFAGDLERAIHASVQASEAFKTSEDYPGAVTAMTNAIILMSGAGRYGDALRHFEAFRDDLSEKQVSTPLTTLLTAVGSVYSHLGLTDEAIATQQAALDAALDQGDDRRAVHARGNLAIAFLNDKQYERALEAVDALLVPEIRDRFPEEAAVSYAVRAACLRLLGRLEEASKTIEEAARRAKAVGDLTQLSAMNEERGELALQLSRPQEALEHFTKASQQNAASGRTGIGDAGAKMGIARALLYLGRLEASLSAVEKAQGAYSLFLGDLGEREGMGFQQEAHRAAEVGIEAAARLAEMPGKHAEAVDRGFALSEVSRGRRVAAAVTNPGSLLQKHMPPELREADLESIQHVRAARSALLRAIRREEAEEIRAARAALEEAWRARRDVVSRIQREASRVASLLYPSPVGRGDIQRHLAACCALLSYHFVHELVFVIVVTREGAQIVDLGKAAPLRDEIARYLRLVSTPGTDDKKLAASLHDRLLSPLAPLLKDKTRLVVVPDAELAFLPFGALVTPKGKRVIENLEVVVTPSATVYHALLRQRSREPSDAVLALGDPAYRNTQLFPPLPGSRQEVNAVAAAFPEHARTTLLGDEANVRALREALDAQKRWYAIHLACHARIDARRPRLSGLVLGNDEMFDLDEVFRTRIDADLVVVSACDSARGKVTEGFGAQGFVRAFFFAGTPRAIVSNWRVPDRSTSELMRTFYEEMRRRKRTPSAALQHAKQAMLARGGRYTHPYYWAPFVLWGLPN